MNFNPKFGMDKFMKITFGPFIDLCKQKNLDINRADFKKDLTHFKTIIAEGENVTVEIKFGK